MNKSYLVPISIKLIKSLAICITLITLILGGVKIYSQRNNQIVIDPESSQYVLKDTLTILTSGQNINKLISPYHGQITLAIKETGTYSVQFPVKNLSELKVIKDKISLTGVQVSYSIVLMPSKNGPQ